MDTNKEVENVKKVGEVSLFGNLAKEVLLPVAKAEDIDNYIKNCGRYEDEYWDYHLISKDGQPNKENVIADFVEYTIAHEGGRTLFGDTAVWLLLTEFNSGLDVLNYVREVELTGGPYAWTRYFLDKDYRPNLKALANIARAFKCWRKQASS